MSSSFVYHNFKVITAKRRSKCKASLCVEFPEQGYIEAGEKCLQVTTTPGTCRSERNSRFCLSCAPSEVQHYMTPFLEVMRELSGTGVRVIGSEGEFVTDNTVQMEETDEVDFCADDIPF